MAKDKRHTIIGDMNAMNLSDGSALTDDEREKLQMTSAHPNKKQPKPMKAM